MSRLVLRSRPALWPVDGVNSEVWQLAQPASLYSPEERQVKPPKPAMISGKVADPGTPNHFPNYESGLK
jgi:hypothetical protein